MNFTQNKRRLFRLLIALLFIISISSLSCFKQRLYNEKQLFMGTVVEVISSYPESADIAFKEIKRIENIFSTYIDSSAISHLNKTGLLNTNFEVVHLIGEAKIFNKLTGGLYDISIGPLTKIWKEAIIIKKLPSEIEIKNAMKLVGFDKVYIDKETHTVKLMVKGMQLDFGSIAKGYAVDAAVKELKRNGIDSAIINAGGNMYCLGTKFGENWQVGLQHPRKRNKLMETISLKDNAVATSGDYEQYMEDDKKRYSHIIDPRTGYPVETDIVSVTIIAKDATTADAVSTSVFLLGKEKGLKTFEKFDGVEKIIVITKDDVQNIK